MHPWDVSPKEAIAIQLELRERLATTDDFSEIKTVAGVDDGFEKNNTITRAAVVVLDFQTLELCASISPTSGNVDAVSSPRYRCRLERGEDTASTFHKSFCAAR